MLIDIARADPWMPMPPDPEERASLCRACSTLNLDELVTPDVANVWPSVRDAIRNDDLAHAVRSLQGRGAGLTPTGDDVIAGMLLADAWSRPGGPAQERRVALASAARTTELSRSFLRWAGRGQSIEPVHRLATVVAPDADKFSGMDRFAAAVDVVVGVGGTSGRALLAGLGIGLVDDLAF